jgi:folate-binding protein YgfZ
MIHASILEDRRLLALKGPDARDFLQGLITNDIMACAEDRAIYAALLTPQGKILFEFFVVLSDENQLLIDCAASRVGDLMKRLALYRLRAKVEIALKPDLAIAVLWGDGATFEIPSDAVSFRDPRDPSLGLRIIATHDVLVGTIGGLAVGDYQAHRLALSVPDSADLPPDSIFALDAGLEELNGVSFNKGCFIGQEVTARMKHRATARRRFFLAEFADEAPPPGTSIVSEGRELGTVATGAKGNALALVRLDRLAEAEAKHAPVTADGRNVHLKRPEWLHG